MRDTDLPAFQQLLGRVAAVFSKKLDESIAPSYFRVLQRCDFVDVACAADLLMAREKFFPKPAQWLEAVTVTPKGEPIPEMAKDEVGIWLDAERRRFEADPCSCEDCVKWEVAEKPLRFVPNVNHFSEHEKRVVGQREVLRGHWAHGFELSRWYKARADCYEVYLRIQNGHPLKETTGNVLKFTGDDPQHA